MNTFFRILLYDNEGAQTEEVGAVSDGGFVLLIAEKTAEKPEKPKPTLVHLTPLDARTLADVLLRLAYDAEKERGDEA